MDWYFNIHLVETNVANALAVMQPSQPLQASLVSTIDANTIAEDSAEQSKAHQSRTVTADGNQLTEDPADSEVTKFMTSPRYRNAGLTRVLARQLLVHERQGRAAAALKRKAEARDKEAEEAEQQYRWNTWKKEEAKCRQPQATVEHITEAAEQSKPTGWQGLARAAVAAHTKNDMLAVKRRAGNILI